MASHFVSCKNKGQISYLHDLDTTEWAALGVEAVIDAEHPFPSNNQSCQSWTTQRQNVDRTVNHQVK